MNIENNIFKKSIVNFNKLLQYGFQKEKDNYIYRKNIMSDKFKIIVEINNNEIKGKVIDLAFNEEYNNFRIENIKGDFVNKVKNEYINVLNDIKENCFEEKYFIYNQANRITELIIKEYNNKPEFLWDKSPDCGVFRNENNNKWYAIIMNVKRNKLDKGDDEVEVINIKLDTEKIDKLLSKKGFYKAYHMNKKYWITIILDDTLSDNEIIKYIKESHDLIS